MGLGISADRASMNSRPEPDSDDLLDFLEHELRIAYREKEFVRDGFVQDVMGRIEGARLSADLQTDECIAVRVVPGDIDEDYHIEEVKPEIGGERVLDVGGVVLRTSLLCSQERTVRELLEGVQELKDE